MYRLSKTKTTCIYMYTAVQYVVVLGVFFSVRTDQAWWRINRLQKLIMREPMKLEISFRVYCRKIIMPTSLRVCACVFRYTERACISRGHTGQGSTQEFSFWMNELVCTSTATTRVEEQILDFWYHAQATRTKAMHKSHETERSTQDA